MVPFLGAHRADDGEVLGLAGELRQVRTEKHPRHGRLDRFEGAAIGVAGLGVEGVGLARAARHPEENARLAAVRVCGRIRRQGLDPAGSGGAEAPAAASRITCRRVSCGTWRFGRLMATLPLRPTGASRVRTGQVRSIAAARDGPGQWFRWNSGPFRMAQKMSASAFAWSSAVFLRSTNRTSSASSSGLGRRVRVAR